MDWTTIIVTTITTTGSITLAWLALRSKLAELGKAATEAKHKAEEAATSGFALFERTRQLRLYLRTSTGDVVDVNTPPFLNS